MRWTWMAILALAAGCNGIELEQLVKQHASRTRITPEPPGVHCAQGGQAVLSGLDLDDNGVLDDAEVTTTEYACATVRTRVHAEQAGAHCEHGGQAVQSGVDVDANGTLDDAEVTGTEYVCATPVPGLLVRTRQVPPGERCPNGGQVSHAGNDIDGDAVLDDGEVVREVYGCTETEPVLARLSVRPFRAFDGCGTDGTTVKAGADLNHDGELDDAEVRGEAGACINLNQARLLQRPEPAGSACVNGGTLVGLGEDLDGNGALGEAEVSARVFVCQPALTYDGDYFVDDPADLEALRGISRIRGKLYIEGDSLTQVVLPGLVVVEGALRIHYTQALTRVDFRGLRVVGQELHVSNNAKLETLVVGAGPELETWVGTDLNVITNPRLESLKGLASVSPRRGFALLFNDMLQAPGDLVNLQDLSGGVFIMSNPLLRGLPLSNLRTVGEMLELSGNPSLTTLAGLGRLQLVGGDVRFHDNAALVHLTGLPLQDVGGTFFIDGNAQLMSLGGLLHLKQVGSLHITSNAALQRVGPLPVLEFVEDELFVQGNPLLTHVEGLSSLRHVRRLFLGNNTLLTDLSGLERVAWLKQLDVRDNAALASLAPLTSLREVESLTLLRNPELFDLGLGQLVGVTARFAVTDNPKLPGCVASSLADAVYTGPEAERVIARNDEVSTCER